MITAPTLRSTVTLTELRDFVQNRSNDADIASSLSLVFDPVPARAMLFHRVPHDQWSDGQVDGNDYHDELITAIHSGQPVHTAPVRVRPAMQALRQLEFCSAPEIADEEQLLSSAEMRLRGRPDLVGYVHGKRALLELKTIHTLPWGYPFLEHSLQAATLFQLAWNRRPHSRKHFVGVLYVESTPPHRALVLTVQMPDFFCTVASDIARRFLS